MSGNMKTEPDFVTVTPDSAQGPRLAATIGPLTRIEGRIYAGLTLDVGEERYGNPGPMSVNLWTVRHRAAEFLARRGDRLRLVGDAKQIFDKYYDAFHVAPRSDRIESESWTPEDQRRRSRIRFAHYLDEVFGDDVSDEVCLIFAEDAGSQALYQRRRRDEKIVTTRYRGAAVDEFCGALVAALDPLFEDHANESGRGGRH